MNKSEVQTLAIDACEAEIEQVVKEIEKNARIGKTSITAQIKFEGTILYLKQQGFHVESLVVPQFSTTRISWGDE